MATSVLFLCIHNSARSQMAEAYLRKFGGADFQPFSAGLEAGKLNPFAVEAMHEEGIDISQNATRDVHDFVRQGKTFHYVITVCDGASADRCPIFPGVHEVIGWDFPDPSTFGGTHEEKLARTRQVRDLIRQAVLDFIHTIRANTVAGA